MRVLKVLIFCAGVMGVSQAAVADDMAGQEPSLPEGDVAAGEELYQDACKSCHGPKAAGMASFPKLSDKDFDHLAHRLIQYRSGEKVGPNTALMAPNAADLSDQDIADLSIYIADSFD